MSWVEDQWWFGLEDLVIQEKGLLSDLDDYPDPLEECKLGNWITKDGRIIPFKNMTNKHLHNCIKMIEEGRLNRIWALPYLKSELNSR